MDTTPSAHEVATDCYAYLQPDGGWGWSNAGLVVGDGRSLLVDTLFDLRLTEAMLDIYSQTAVTGFSPETWATQGETLVCRVFGTRGGRWV